MEELHFRSQGIPRLINAVCDNLLLTCFALETRTATMEMLDEVAADMRLEYPDRRNLHSDLSDSPYALRRERALSTKVPSTNPR